MEPVDHGVRNRVSGIDSQGKYVDLAPDETALLLYSNTWQTLRRHVEIYTSRYAEHTGSFSQYVEVLEKCAEAGLLVSEDDIRAKIVGSIGKDAGMTNRIEMIGIPTRNRPTELARCIESYMGNVMKYGRTPEFVVADDSDREFLEKNRLALDILRKKYPGTISHHDISKRKEFAHEYSKNKNVEYSIAEFTVCGDDTDQNHVGALRNFLMLYARGRKILMVDDDTICTVHTLPGYKPTSTIESLTISSMPPRPSWFFDSYEQAMNYFPTVDVDYLGEHEKLLGQNVSSLISQISPADIQFDPELGGINNTLFIDIHSQALTSKKVAVTFPGIVGHSWMRAHPPTMVDHTDHPHSLWGNSEEEYRKNRSSANIARMAEGYRLYSGAEYLGVMGLDTSQPLPFFPPVGTNEDANFGYLIHTCFPQYISGIIPYAVEHRRTHAYAPIVDTKPAPYSTWTLTTIVMESIRKNMGQENISIGKLAQTLSQLSKYPTTSIQSLVLNGIQHRLVNSLEYHRRLDAYYSHKPDYWHADTHEIIKQTEIFLQSDLSLLIPFFKDMNSIEGKKFGWEDFREWIGKWGKVL